MSFTLLAFSGITCWPAQLSKAKVTKNSKTSPFFILIVSSFSVMSAPVSHLSISYRTMSASFCSKSEREVQILIILTGPFSGRVNYVECQCQLLSKKGCRQNRQRSLLSSFSALNTSYLAHLMTSSVSIRSSGHASHRIELEVILAPFLLSLSAMKSRPDKSLLRAALVPEWMNLPLDS